MSRLLLLTAGCWNKNLIVSCLLLKTFNLSLCPCSEGQLCFSDAAIFELIAVVTIFTRWDVGLAIVLRKYWPQISRRLQKKTLFKYFKTFSLIWWEFWLRCICNIEKGFSSCIESVFHFFNRYYSSSPNCLLFYCKAGRHAVQKTNKKS